MQKIIPNFWFDHNAEEAVGFYQSVFPNTKINDTLYYPKSTEDGLAEFQKDLAGKVLTIDFEIDGFRFVTINADSTFKPNPSISFFYTCENKEEADALWSKLSDRGTVKMALGEYPFSKYYGWVEDKFGFSWQLILNRPEGEKRPKIVPSLMFTGEQDGQAEEAIKFYTSIFKESKIGDNTNYYPGDTLPDRAGKVSYADFQIEDQWFAIMDGGVDHGFSFNEAISLSIECNNQEEIDYYWEKLSAVPKAEVCGWLKDKYGVSWQVAPKSTNELLKIPGAFKRMMGMKKIDIEKLKDNEDKN